MGSRAAVLRGFNQPLQIEEFPLTDPAPGEVIVRIEAAGVCGSDVHMWRGRDPRTPLPLILGHEGVGRVARIGGEKRDLFGKALTEGDRVVWERGVMCGRCYYCVVRKQPALCASRRTYGISISCKEPPHLRGCYAEHIHLMPGAHLIRIEKNVDPRVLVAATCSGATAAHGIEQAAIQPGETVVIIGRGPLGLFALAFALLSGAPRAVVVANRLDEARRALCQRMGADEVLSAEGTTLDERVERVRALTDGLGADVVLECTGSAKPAEEGIRYVRPYGRYLILGIATPVGRVSWLAYEDIARKNVRVQGVWVSDTSHLYRAVQLVLSNRFPFESLVTHTFSLEDATRALEHIEGREAVKAVIVP